jgi:hypothetical protein
MQKRLVVLRTLIFLVPVFALIGCRHVYAPQPNPPTLPPAVVPVSHVSVAVSVPLSLPHDALNSNVPQRMDADDNTVSINGGADNCGSGASIGYHVQRGDIGISGSGNTLLAQSDVAYNLEGRGRERGCVLGVCACTFLINGSCGRGSDPEPHLALSASATLSGVDASWNPQVTVNPINVQANGACSLTILNIHIEDKLAGFVTDFYNNQRGTMQQDVITALNLPDKAAKAWAALQQPIKVGDSAWLSIHPVNIGVLPTQIGSAIGTGVALEANPVLILQTTQPAADTGSLPPPASVQASNAFFVALTAQAPYSVIEKQLKDALKVGQGGTRYPPTGGNYVTVNDASVYAYGAKAVIRLDLKVHGIFGRKATLYLTGTPAFDSARNVISFPDLDFTVESKNILLRLAAWIEQDTLRNDLRGRATFNIDSYVMAARQTLLTSLNQSVGALTLQGNVNDLTVLGVYTSTTDQTFKAVLQTSGTLNAVLK